MGGGEGEVSHKKTLSARNTIKPKKKRKKKGERKRRREKLLFGHVALLVRLPRR